MINEIEISPYGNMLVYKKGYTPEFVSNVIKERRLDGLRIFDHLDKLNTLDFLKDYTFLKVLHIDCINDHDFSFLKSLTQLKDLHIGISVKQFNEIDLSFQYNLEILGINWRKKIIGLENCKKLSLLTLADFMEPNLKRIENLESLTDVRIKTGTIESLNGLQGLANLGSLSFGYCKRLKSIHSINHLVNLKTLRFEKCPNIKDYESLTNLPALVSLSLIDCGKIESIKFIQGFSLLEELSLLGNTVVKDGDLTPAKEIKSVVHKHYNHYNIKIENKEYDENVRSNLQKIKDLFR